ncbi:AbgT family transporter [Edaphobacillus lindanitolerans]|uniref:Aminobenzoyl-glutamate transport protein n=1 Tax=Edaphobacillus lindanitolerans TaxID=550447 RepID=A0A1U7PND5_9BACI|nr:AbgT family transporter [Edaphobacillus lindanitolerans]SIT87380.1 aminobenzoyl-glutamate transport protein [Edaphobacillus lindanitolerans]
MASATEAKGNSKKNFFGRFLDFVEKYGNKLPDPVMLFVYITAAILVASAVFGLMGVTAKHPGTGETITVVNLLSGAGIVQMLTGLVSNFTGFPPLGLVLVVMLGVGLAESTGLITAFMKASILKAPQKIILPTIILVAICGNAAADAAMVVLPPIVAMIFVALGRHPIAGLAAAYAACAGGFGANLILSVSDPLIYGFTEPAAHIVDDSYKGNPMINYYFIAVSAIVLVPVATFVTNRIVEPRLGKYRGTGEEISEEITSSEKKGLLWAGASLVIAGAVIAFMTLPENAILRNPDDGGLIVSPFMDSIVPIMMILFLIPAIVYGKVTGSLKDSKDLGEQLGKAMSGMGTYIVIAFVAAQMIAYFNWSNLGPIVAIKGAALLESIGFTGLPLFIGFIIIAALINFLVASQSAKWAILAPVFIPMFMLLGYDPAVTQAAYRVGDSITNPITPMLAYFAIALTFAKRFDPKMGMGTFMTSLLPFSIAFAIMWTVVFAVWFLLGLPLGPGGGIFMDK